MARKLSPLSPSLLAELVGEERQFIVKVGAECRVPNYGGKPADKLKPGDTVAYIGNFSGECRIGIVTHAASNSIIMVRNLPRINSQSVGEFTSASVHISDVSCKLVKWEKPIEPIPMYRLWMRNEVEGLAPRDTTISVDTDLFLLETMRDDLMKLPDHEGLEYFVEEV